MTAMNEISGLVTHLLNGTFQSLDSVIPLKHTISKPILLEEPLPISFGVLIGMTGNIKGKLVIDGDRTVFASIGERMFGTPLEEEMLKSFTGELGNMIAGGLSTNIAQQGIRIEITAPSVIEGSSQITGFKRAIYIPIQFNDKTSFDLSLLMDE